ncbi:MAG: 50S ribosomal protein L23 [Candidatus Micrarchaeaceae archaeon]
MSVLMYPIGTEKAITNIDRNNEIQYIVSLSATKKQIKEEFEKFFGVKIISIRLMNTFQNRKKAIIKLSKDYKAGDVAVKLKLV